MKNIIEHTVYYADTDAYGVVWHGTYLRWMEQGRVEICRAVGLDLTELKNNNVMIPVTNINVRFKASAKLDDKICIETEISKISPITITFIQCVKSKDSNRIFVQAEIEVVAVNQDGKIYRRIPEILKSACERAME